MASPWASHKGNSERVLSTKSHVPRLVTETDASPRWAGVGNSEETLPLRKQSPLYGHQNSKHGNYKFIYLECDTLTATQWKWTMIFTCQVRTHTQISAWTSPNYPTSKWQSQNVTLSCWALSPLQAVTMTGHSKKGREASESSATRELSSPHAAQGELSPTYSSRKL